MIRKCFFVLILTICNTHAASLTGTVVAVADGDTITVLDSNNRKHRIRLGGIDAPEKSQSYGQRSKQSLSELVYDKNVTIQYEKQDRYGRFGAGRLLDRGLKVHPLALCRQHEASKKELFCIWAGTTVTERLTTPPPPPVSGGSVFDLKGIQTVGW